MGFRSIADFDGSIGRVNQRAGAEPSAPLVVLPWRNAEILFVVQIVTGIVLAFYYQAAPATAYESVRHITEEVSYGWYFRSIHKWAATLMIAAVIQHQMRVYFTGAYRKPREINWMVGARRSASTPATLPRFAGRFCIQRQWVNSCGLGWA